MRVSAGKDGLVIVNGQVLDEGGLTGASIGTGRGGGDTALFAGGVLCRGQGGWRDMCHRAPWRGTAATALRAPMGGGAAKGSACVA